MVSIFIQFRRTFGVDISGKELVLFHRLLPIAKRITHIDIA